MLAAGLAEGDVLTKSVALQLARWTRRIPAEFRGQAEEILIAAARSGADERALAAICAEIVYRTAPRIRRMSGTRIWTGACRSTPRLTGRG